LATIRNEEIKIFSNADIFLFFISISVASDGLLGLSDGYYLKMFFNGFK